MADLSLVIQIVTGILIALPSALAGAFWGAKFAYKNERKEKNKERKNSDLAAVLETTLYLHMMWNELLDYRKLFIEPVRNEKFNFITMRPSINFGSKHEIPWPRLVFLEEKSPGLLLELSTVQSSFQEFFQGVNNRDEQHIREVQPKLGTANSIQFTEEFMCNLLGNYLFQSMKQNTGQIIQYADPIIEDFSPLLDKLHKATTKIYPDAKFASARESSKSNSTDNPSSSG